jgi:hypothetical protein
VHAAQFEGQATNLLGASNAYFVAAAVQTLLLVQAAHPVIATEQGIHQFEDVSKYHPDLQAVHVVEVVEVPDAAPQVEHPFVPATHE